MRTREKENIKCPFYADSTANTITCEGFIENTVMFSRFPSAEALGEHAETFCYKEDGGECPLALNLYDKYERLEALAEKHRKEKAIYERG